MISVHLDGLRRADVSNAGGFAAVVLRVGAYDRVSLLVRTEAQARIIAEAINAGLGDTPPSILDRKPGGA
jgi:hypothetical protein